MQAQDTSRHRHESHMFMQARKPVLYVGGGCLDSSKELREFVAKTGIPVASTLMGLGAFPDSDALALQVCPCCPLCFSVALQVCPCCPLCFSLALQVCPCCPLCLSVDRQVLLFFGRVPLWIQAPGQCQAVILLWAILPCLCKITAAHHSMLFTDSFVCVADASTYALSQKF